MWAGSGGVFFLGLDPAGQCETEDGTEERVDPVGERVGSGEKELVVQVAEGKNEVGGSDTLSLGKRGSERARDVHEVVCESGDVDEIGLNGETV